MKILNVEFHRNGSGVCESFFAVLFEDKKVIREWSSGICGKDFIATFRTDSEDSSKIIWESFRCVNVKNFNLNFRGDHFINDLEKEIKNYCNNLNLKEGNFSAAAFPEQYKIKEALND